MKTFVTAVLIAASSAVDVMKARHNSAYDAPTTSHYAAPAPAPAHYAPTPRYQKPEPLYEEKHWHYDQPSNVNFSAPVWDGFKAPEVNYETNWFKPYVPKYKVNHADVVYAEADLINEAPTFTPYSFFEHPAEKPYGDPIYDPLTDHLHKTDKHIEEEAVHVEEEEVVEEVVEDVYLGIVEAAPCDCTAYILERDELLEENSALTSELYLYQARYGYLLPEEPVYYDDEVFYSDAAVEYAEEGPETYEVPEMPVFYEPEAEEEEDHYEEESEEEDDSANYFIDHDDYQPESYTPYAHSNFDFFNFVLSQGFDGDYNNRPEEDESHHDSSHQGHGHHH